MMSGWVSHIEPTRGTRHENYEADHRPRQGKFFLQLGGGNALAP
jgi:hypothetical protein